jgi:hypothetical protein
VFSHFFFLCRTPKLWANFCFLQCASLPIDHISQKSQDLIRTLLITVVSKSRPYFGGPLEGFPPSSSCFMACHFLFPLGPSMPYH